MHHDIPRRTSLRRVTVSFTVVTAVLVLALAFGPGVASASAENVSTCTTIDGSGEYNLTNDIADSGAGTCLNVTASDVVIDGQGHAVDGVNATDSVGIRLSGSSDARVRNVTIRNVVLSDWANGINATHADDVTIEGVTVSGAEASGIALAPVGGTVDVRETTVREGVTDREGADAVFVRGRARDLAFTNLTVSDAGYEGLDVGYRSAFRIDTVDGNVTVRDASFSETGRTAADIDIEGNLTVTGTGFASTGTEPFSNPSMDVTSLRSITLRDLSVEGGITEEGGIEASAFSNDPDRSNAITARNVFINGTHDSLSLVGGDRVAVANATITNITATNPGITAHSTEGLTTVRDVRLADLTGDGIDVQAGTNPDDHTLPDTARVVVENATLERVTSQGIHHDALGDAAPLSVRSTTIDGVLDGLQLNSGNASIRNVTIRNADRDGIDASDDGRFDALSMTDVTIHNTSEDGIRAAFIESVDLTRVNMTEVGTLELAADRSEGTLTDVWLSTNRVDGSFRDVEVNDSDSPGNLPTNWTSIGSFLAVRDATDDTPEPTPSYMNASFRYDDGDVSDVDERTLSVWRHDGNWTQVGGTVDRGANAVTKNITDFSVFAPLAVPTSLGLDPGNLSVTIDSTTSPVNETVPFGVEATVTNTGDVQSTRTITMSLNGTERDAAGVTLSPGESTTVSLRWQTEPGDAGTYDLTVASPDDSASTTVEVVDPAGPRPVRSCKVIEWPGSYALSESIETSTRGPCIEINASDVVFSGGGNAIDWNPGTDYDAFEIGVKAGEESTSLHNVTVRDLTLTDWELGVFVENVDDVRFDGVTARNGEQAIRTFRGGGTIDLRRVTVRNGSEAMPAVSVRSDAEQVTAANLSVSDAGTVGLDVGGVLSNGPTSGNVTIADTTIRGTPTDGISVRAEGDVSAENVTVRDAGTVGLNLSVPVGNASVADALIDGAATGIRASASGTVTNTTTRDTVTTLWVSESTVVSADDLTVGGNSVAPTTLSFTARTNASSRVEVSSPERLVEPPERNRSVFRFVDVAVGAGASLGNVRVAYDDAGADNLEESSLRIWRYGGEWTALGGSVDTAANTVTLDRIDATDGRVTLAPLGTSTDPEPTYAVSVDGDAVEAGETFAITVVATNDGGEMLDGITLTRNGEAIDARTVRLGANSVERFTVNQTFRYPSPAEAVFELSVVGTDDSARVTLAGVDRPPQPDWTGWHLPPENDNHDPGLAPPRPPLSLAWNTSVRDGDSVPMKPLVVDDTVYAYTYEGAFAMDAGTGAMLWNNSHVNGTYLGGMAYDDGRVVVSTSDDGLKALDASTGEIVWTRDDIDTTNTAPTVLNGTVLIGGDNSDLWALDAATGGTVWNYTYADNGLPADFSSPTAANGRVFVPGSDGTMYAHDADDGSVLWTREIGYSEATPAVRDGIVYAADSGAAPYLQALDAETGETVWNATAGLGYTGLAVTDDTVFMATCGDSMFAYNATTGDLRWNRSGIGCAYDVSEPVVAGGTVYSTTYGNRALALDRETGETVYAFEMPGCCKGTAPVPYDGRLYVADRYATGEVYAFAGPEWPRVLPDQALVNESTTLTVLGEYSDEPIANATLRVDGTTLTTDENGTATHTFESGGTYDVAVTVPDADRVDYAETRRTITVVGEGFGVTVDSTNAPVVEGETLTVNATVENTGTTQETRAVSLSIGGAVRDSVDVTLAAGESQSVTLSWTTADGDAGDYLATVESGENAASDPVSVLEPANFSVAIQGTNSPVREGETLNVSANVTNTGDVQGTQTVTLSIDGTQRDSRTLTLGGSASRTVTLSWTPTSGDAGAYTATLASANDSASTAVTVESTDETGTVAPGQPGFGIVFGTAALLVVALFARLRCRQ